MNPFSLTTVSRITGAGTAPRVWRALAVLALMLLPHPTFAATPISTCAYVVSAPGSYSLTADLTCPSVGILIAASGVDLDLNHHVVASGSSTGVGIITATQDPFIPATATLDFSSCVTVTGVHIHGGTVRNFSQGIVICSGNASTYGPSVPMSATIDHVVSQYNHVGIALLSSGRNTLDTNFLSFNDAYGIQLENAATNLVGKNLVDNNNIGISINNNSNLNTVLVNSVTSSYYIGVRITDSHGNAVSNNFFTDGNNGSTANGILLAGGNSGNTIAANIAFYSNSDLVDLAPCGTNTWNNNFFGTSLGFCIH